jgi:hypothetical protein
MDESGDLGRAICEQLEGLGSDVTKIHVFDFYLYFPSEDAAREAASVLRGRGFMTKVREGADEVSWLCLARVKTVPDMAVLREMGVLFENLVASFSGEFDGWESNVIAD